MNGLMRRLVWAAVAAFALHNSGATAQDVAAPDAAASDGAMSKKGVGQPLWELGLAVGTGWVPDYPAAGHNSLNILPIPYVVYRGEFLRAGDGALVRGRFIHTDDMELDISLDGSFPAEDNSDRAGMPDLDYLVELGPKLQYTLLRDARSAKVDLEVPLRAVISTDLGDLNFRGVVFNPVLAYQNERLFDIPGAFKLSVGPVFGTEKLTDYFYEVAPAYATAARPAYDAKAGYMGSEVQAAYYRPFTPWLKGFAVAQASVNYGATNQDSPLYKEDVNFGFGVGVVMSLIWSKARVHE
jgi:MipA family protein